MSVFTGDMNCIGKKSKFPCTANAVHLICSSFRCNSYRPWTPGAWKFALLSDAIHIAREHRQNAIQCLNENSMCFERLTTEIHTIKVHVVTSTRWETDHSSVGRNYGGYKNHYSVIKNLNAINQTWALVNKNTPISNTRKPDLVKTFQVGKNYFFKCFNFFALGNVKNKNEKDATSAACFQNILSIRIQRLVFINSVIVY